MATCILAPGAFPAPTSSAGWPQHAATPLSDEGRHVSGPHNSSGTVMPLRALGRVGGEIDCGSIPSLAFFGVAAPLHRTTRRLPWTVSLGSI
jgi:hypothetical protein